MPSVNNVKGALLEELILYLLSNSGYATVGSPGTDKTLRRYRGMLWVKGRGEWHQIDAIADYLFSPPFSYPQRLLVEGKCEYRPIGLGVVRNSVGVQIDVSEFFVPDPGTDKLLKQRYHYQSAIFSASGFSPPAQNYAYAQDILLLNLNAGPFKRIIASLNRIRPEDIPDDLSISTLRDQFRDYLERGDHDVAIAEKFDQAFRISYEIAHYIGFVCVVMIGGIFPIFLVPQANGIRGILFENDRLKCRIHIEEQEFRISSEQGILFHFSIPEVLFKKCFEKGEFSQVAALNMKQQYLNEIEVLVYENQILHRCTLELDSEWLNRIRRKL